MDESHRLFIFKRASEFLNPKEIGNLLCLSKSHYEHLKHSEVCLYLLINFLSTLFQRKVTSETYISDFEEYSGIKLSSIVEIPRICYVQNLIKNPNGALGFDHWEKEDDGDGWCIENYFTFNNSKTIFVGSYEECSLSVNIELSPFTGLKLFGRKAKLVVGSPVKRRWDCGNTVSLKVIIENNLNESRKSEKTVVPKYFEQVEREFSCPWELLGINMELEQNDTIAKICFYGKDEKWWAGNYGPRLGYCFARVYYY
ncbi:hypothetical protein SteCoe_14166 [Stentor coeruleus]|uniref:FBA domain-containing protein n=1 Tax=Stentor coeruleus TaxID=5963 RepID=A0A1R2C6N5_9CILI|nr:hypothetical protein SteCoe_14166 [Stentor coeruleus]